MSLLTLSGGRMLVRSSDEACVSTLKKIVVTDQHGLTAIFEDVAPTQDTDSFGNDLQKHLQADAKYPNLHLDISGHSSNRGTQISYTYTLRDSAQGNNTVGTNAGDIGTATQVTVLGVPLPDVSPNKATAWAVIDGSGTAGTFSASIAAESTAPCGSATYAVELYAQTGATSSELAASGVPAQTTLGAVQSFDTLGNTSIIQDCRGLTTNLYLKLSCTNAIGTSYKLVAIQSQIPNSPYTPIGDGTSPGHVCANAATAASLPAVLTANDAAAHPSLFMPPQPPVFSAQLTDILHQNGYYQLGDAIAACRAYTGDAGASADDPGTWRLPTKAELLVLAATYDSHTGYYADGKTRDNSWYYWSASETSTAIASLVPLANGLPSITSETSTGYVSCVK